MARLLKQLNHRVADAFAEAGFDASLGVVTYSNRLDLCQYQCNGAMVAAKALKKNPRDIAAAIVPLLSVQPCFAEVAIAGPGFINLSLTDAYLVSLVAEMSQDPRLGCELVSQPERLILDYGGANIAKPLHVGHLRSGIIGECLKRLARFLGHAVKSDVHLGDWGLQMGMVIHEIACRQPDLPYFDSSHPGPFPQESPVSIEDLEAIYPAIASRAKQDAQVMADCRRVTAMLQKGHPGYQALWQHIYNVSVADLRDGYDQLNIEFDLWLGESDTRTVIPELLERLKATNQAIESDGAWVVEVARPGDTIPPLLLTKTDGAVLYGTTDLATIAKRVEDYDPHAILYVVDRRQHVHFEQVFRAARKTKIASENLGLEHIGFGTMNGKDGKPFKTRAGGVMKLKDLIQMILAKAAERIQDSGFEHQAMHADERADIARMVGIATLKYADLNNHPSTDYTFDLERFSAFDGRTGPYQLYTVARIRSILNKAKAKAIQPGALLPPQDATERALLLKLTELPEVIHMAYERRAPNFLCEFCYTLGAAFNTFYHDHHILRETAQDRQGSWLTLAQTTLNALILVLDLLGIETPERM